MELKEIWISNFKSLRDVKLKLKKFSVVVGANATGKTNLIEFFKFLRKAMIEQTQPPMPYLEWWSYRNIVWAGMEHLPIKASLRFDSYGYDSTYEVSFSGAGGAFRILSEKLSINGVLSVEREGSFLRITHDEGFVASNRWKIEHLLKTMGSLAGILTGAKVTPDSLIKQEIMLPSERYVSAPFGTFEGWFVIWFEDFSIAHLRVGDETETGPIILCPVRKGKGIKPLERPEIRREPLFEGIISDIREGISEYLLLRPINLREVRIPALVKREQLLAEDASNLVNIMHNIFIEKGKLPERIEAAISTLFPGMHVGLELTPDGRVFMKVYQNGLQLQPPSISDGFYKVLAILVAIESKPSLLAIDEIENSLHAKTLEYLIDELRNSETTVIITTHSAIVVDIVKPEDILIAERGPEGTTLRSIERPEEVRKKMKELGVTQSEMWLYGEIK